jgi:hypothetical protein
LIADFIVIDVASPVEKLMLSPPRRDVVCCAGHALGDDAYTKDFVAPALAFASRYRTTTVLDPVAAVTFAALSAHAAPHSVDGWLCPVN